MIGMLDIWSLSRSDHGTHMPCSDGFDWSASSDKNCQWYGTLKKLIKISDDNDCYYCINNTTYPIYVYYRSVKLVTIPNIYPLSYNLYTLLHFLILVTLHVLTHYSCIRIFCIPCILFHVYYVDIVTV